MEAETVVPAFLVDHNSLNFRSTNKSWIASKFLNQTSLDVCVEKIQNLVLGNKKFP